MCNCHWRSLDVTQSTPLTLFVVYIRFTRQLPLRRNPPSSHTDFQLANFHAPPNMQHAKASLGFHQWTPIVLRLNPSKQNLIGNLTQCPPRIHPLVGFVPSFHLVQVTTKMQWPQHGLSWCLLMHHLWLACSAFDHSLPPT